MSVFNDYAKYYDLFYKDKDYQAEADYVDNLLKANSTTGGNELLNIGCGTGLHDRYFHEKGYSVDAFDMSENMLNIAKEENSREINFFKSTIKDFCKEKKYDYIISLFHVMSYQTANDEVDSLFRIVKNNLKPGGVFLFDCWYGPAILTEKPEIRIKEVECDKYKIKRIAHPQLLPEENTVVVNYEINIIGDENNCIDTTKESHRMRYFFLPEIELFGRKQSCEILHFYEWMKSIKPSINSWNICLVGKQNN